MLALQLSRLRSTMLVLLFSTAGRRFADGKVVVYRANQTLILHTPLHIGLLVTQIGLLRLVVDNQGTEAFGVLVVQ
eukprot:1350989-Amphidinium_carterae.1